MDIQLFLNKFLEFNNIKNMQTTFWTHQIKICVNYQKLLCNFCNYENYQKSSIFVIMKIFDFQQSKGFSVIKDNVWKKYDKITPMMSIGLTDHILSLKELLTYPYHKNISI
jgi:hypothetical protein